MVKVIFIDNHHEEVESHSLNMTMEDALKALPGIDYGIGVDGICYDKTGLVIADIEGKTIEIQIDFSAEK